MGQLLVQYVDDVRCNQLARWEVEGALLDASKLSICPNRVTESDGKGSGDMCQQGCCMAQQRLDKTQPFTSSPGPGHGSHSRLGGQQHHFDGCPQQFLKF